MNHMPVKSVSLISLITLISLIIIAAVLPQIRFNRVLW